MIQEQKYIGGTCMTVVMFGKKIGVSRSWINRKFLEAGHPLKPVMRISNAKLYDTKELQHWYANIPKPQPKSKFNPVYKTCCFCGTEYTKKKYKNGARENKKSFDARKWCDHPDCVAKGRSIGNTRGAHLDVFKHFKSQMGVADQWLCR